MQSFYTFFNPDTEQFDDKETYELIGRGENLGLFQIETVPMINFCKKFKPSNLDDLSSVLAIIRPDTMAYIPDILKNKERPEEITYIHPDMKSILESTHGVLLYQEQLIEIVKKFGGFTGGQADLFRRAIGKKKPEEVKKWADLFLKQGVELGYPSSVIQTLYDDLSAKGGYLFNKSHSIAYAQLSYFTAYLKTHYPLQFMTSILSNQKKDDGACDYESLSKYLSECRRMGIKVTPPDINKSELWFSIIDNNINFGIGLVKGVGQKELENIIDNRPYTSFEDYLVRCSCDKTSTIALIKCGAFDSFNTNKIGLMKQFYSWRYINCKESQNPLTKLNATILTNLLDNGFIEHSDTEIVKKVLKAKDPNKVLTIANERRKNIFVESQMEEYNIKDELAWQFETMNTYLNKTPFTDICLPDWDLVDPSSSRNSYDNAAWIGGTVTAINKKVGKSGRSIGKPFAFVSLDTIYGKIEVTFFSKEYEKYVDLLERGKCLVCYGRKDGDYSMVVIDAYPLELYIERMGV